MSSSKSYVFSFEYEVFKVFKFICVCSTNDKIMISCHTLMCGKAAWKIRKKNLQEKIFKPN